MPALCFLALGGRANLRGSRLARLQNVGKRGAVRRAKSATRIPSRSGIVTDVLELPITDPIVSRGDVMESARPGGQCIKLRIYESDSPLKLLVNTGNQC